MINSFKQKRLIKFHNIYTNDGIKFSNCSTKYEVLPYVVDANAGASDLKRLALQLGLKTKGKVIEIESEFPRVLVITHAITLDETVKGKNWNSKETYQVYLGLITIPELHSLPVSVKPNQKVPKKVAHSLIDSGDCGAENTCEINNEYLIIMEGWDYFHRLPMNGYNLESFEKAAGIDDRVFYDQVESCSICGAYDWCDDGYNYNFRHINCESLGINCGCFGEYSMEPENFANNSESPIELETAERLQEQGRLKFIERFGGGMTDSWRTHSYGGETVRIGKPSEILKDLLKENPNKKFVFSHDESGQFQTYFSVWQICKPKSKRKTG